MAFTDIILKTESEIKLIENAIKINNDILSKFTDKDPFIKVRIIDYIDFLTTKKEYKENSVKTLNKLV